ncbi:MAG: molybdopterin converting factor [Armatimonadetes bacterium]|nr:molybdopterin converting factor [Armatimonadota bacterium]
MQITVSLFAAHREAVGTPTVQLAVPDGTTAGGVWDILTAQYLKLNRMPRPTTVAINDAVVPPSTALAHGDRVALLAPVSGGSLVELVRDPIRVEAVLDSVRHPGAGAAVLFLGTVRDHSRGRDVERLEYEAYEALARTEMARIAEQAAERWGARIAIVHRLGALAIGEISVAIAVAAPHRREAFEAGRFAIDTLKQTVPIWKKEIWAGGAEWIGEEEPSAPPAAPEP